MRCFVITRKHIFFAAVLIFSVLVTGIFLNSIHKKEIPVFKNEELISEILPSGKKPSFVRKMKNYINDESEAEAGDMLNKYSPFFKEKTPEPTPDVSPEPVTETASPVYDIPKIENKSITGNLSKIQNATDYEINTEDYKNEGYSFPKDGIVLIVHTHTTESYASENINSLTDNSRNVDESQNMLSIGEVFKNVLEKNNIGVIHDRTVHDYPSYQGSYTRSLNTIKRNISENGKIAAVLDIHRDAVVKSDGTRIKLSSEINGKECAQIMVVCGTDGMGLSHPKWRNNLNFGIKITEQAECIAPGLMRPINLREERFNQHLTENSLIIEVGTNGNTLTEAKQGAEFFAQAVSDVINNAKK